MASIPQVLNISADLGRENERQHTATGVVDIYLEEWELSTFRASLPTVPRPIWRSATLILLFNGMFLAWALIKPGSHALFIAVVDCALALGPLLMALLCFATLGRRWRQAPSGTASTPHVRNVRRWTPTLLSLGLLSYVIGQSIWVCYDVVLHQPAVFPGWDDAGYLGVYPFLLLGILFLPTRPLPAISRLRIVLDGLMIMTAVVAFSWYFILGPTMLQGDGTTFAKLVGAAYPFSDLLMIFCLLRLVFGSSDAGSRPIIRLLSSALFIMVLTDIIYDYQTLQGHYGTNGVLEVGWSVGFMLLGLAIQAMLLVPQKTSGAIFSSQVSTGEATSDMLSLWRSLFPYAFVPAVGLLAVYIWHTGGKSVLEWGVYLGGALLIGLVLLRQVLAMRETVTYAKELHIVQEELRANNRALSEANSRLETLATTDPLTGLLNHRAFIAALNQEIKRSERYSRSCTLLFLDLDHFKALNDGYGHPAGDAVLQEFSTLVQTLLRGMDTLGRWGGEEFVALLPETDREGGLEAGERIRAAIAANLFAVGGGTRLTCSVGVATYPFDSEEREGLVTAADRAMYGAKKLGRNQVRTASDPAILALETEQPGSREDATLAGTVEALTMLVEARDHYTGQHTLRVSALTARLALALGLDASEAYMISLAGRLHDVGKVAVPDAILQKPAGLTEEEQVLMRRHPVVGGDVISRVPSLRAIAPIIRAHHERWDGSGYPDGLAGEKIPLGARIVAVADAYEAMTTNRPYQPAREEAWALAELRRSAGTQFDPSIVEAFERVSTVEQAPAAHGGV